jgi:hypothetical protein
MTFSRRGLLQFGMLAGAANIFRVAASAAPAPSSPLFNEVPASASGITWTHENAMSPSRFLPEALGPGCAFLDYDNDGWMDIFLVNSGPSDFYKPPKPLRNALYKNNRDGTFTDVTEKAGVSGAYFGMGVAVGDYDNDGWPDILVTSYGSCILYKNNHDGTFSDVTERAGVATPGFTTSAVWFDYDNDGRLDLFICSFVEYGGVGSWSAAITRSAEITTASRGCSSPVTVSYITTTATVLSLTSPKGPPLRPPWGRGSELWPPT